MSIPLITDPTTASRLSNENQRAKNLEQKLQGLSEVDREKLVKAAQEFESMFMDIVVQSMRGTVETSDVMGGSEKVKMFQTMLDSEYAKLSAQNQGLNIADQIIRQVTSRMTMEKMAQEGSLSRENR